MRSEQFDRITDRRLTLLILLRLDANGGWTLQGALVARLQADGVLLGNRLSDVVGAKFLALRAKRVIRQNFAWAGLYNLACVPLAIAGYLPPWAAGLGMATSSLVVVLNSLRLAR